MFIKKLLIKNLTKSALVGVTAAVMLAACSNGSSSSNNQADSTWVPISVAYEIINTATIYTNPTLAIPTYKGGGTNPITESEWDGPPLYTPPFPYVANTTRNLQFNEQIFIASPGQNPGVTTYITTSDGYTWGAMSQAINAMWPFTPNMPPYESYPNAYYAGNFVTTPAPGTVKVTVNYKAQDIKFYANESDMPTGTPGAIPLARFIVTDQWGNKYIMHASAGTNPTEVESNFAAAVLPNGWTKQTIYLTNDLILQPATAPSNQYEYLVIRDSADNSYHQFYWSPQGISLAAQTQGLPIWGGNGNNTIKITNSWDNLIYGAGGANLFIFVHTLHTGINTIADFNAAKGDRLSFDGQNYSTVITAGGMQINLSGGAVVILSGVGTFSDSWVVG